MGLSRAAVFIAIEDDMCTQEAPIEWYVTAKTTYFELMRKYKDEL